MKKMYKAMLLVLCAVLLVAGSVMGTMAYLQSKTDKVTNTFTVGNVKITLDEAEVTEYGVPVDPATRIPNATKKGNAYKLIPGHTYTKDPTIHVDANSEDCWLFIRLKNDIEGIETAVEGIGTIKDQLTANGWTELDDVAGVYYHAVAKANDNVKTFEKFAISGTADISGYAEGKTIEITAYAVQKDGFANAKAAWDAANFS